MTASTGTFGHDDEENDDGAGRQDGVGDDAALQRGGRDDASMTNNGAYSTAVNDASADGIGVASRTTSGHVTSFRDEKTRG